MMNNNIIQKPKILFISSADPTKSAGVLGMDFYKAFKGEGYEIDFLTKYPVPEYKHIISVYKTQRKNIFYKFYNLGRKIFKHARQLLFKDAYPIQESCFFYRKETKPPVPYRLVLNTISQKYDLVIILFWQELLSYQAVEAIYDKLHAPIFFLAVDYSPITGGCHFFGNCQRYKIGCGCCPSWNSNNPNDFTHFNILYRKRVIDKIRPVIFANTYMNQFINESFLFKGYDVKHIFPVIDENIYCIRDKKTVRRDLEIPQNKFVLYFASQNLDDPRKGITYLLDALNIFVEKLEQKEKDSIFVITAGHTSELISSRIPFAHKEFGFVNPKQLPLIASAASLFLCSSVNDAGPMMVNQSLSCGVPVVAFEMGTALDVVKNKGTGYCAKMKDAVDFSDKIYQVFKTNMAEYEQMVLNCRKIALNTTSQEITVSNILSSYYNYEK